METKGLVDMLPFTVADFEFETLGATLYNVEAATEVDTPPVRLTVANSTTLGQTQVDVYPRH